ncbi:MAG: hypothetical protein JWQ87_5331 [Candidatus Sulfotelmatobacter sp.]|nr:hypothetical protein [Candidatus Sulfotelmatobacter sp.]
MTQSCDRIHLTVPITLLSTMLLFSSGCSARRFSLAAPAPPAIPASADFFFLGAYKEQVAAYKTVAPDATSPNLDTAKYIRNDIARRYMGDINYVYYQYNGLLFTGKSTEAFIAEAEQLGLTAAATIVLQARTKTILSALASGVTGVNLSVEKNFFQQQTFSALAIAMQARRDKAKITILANLELSVTDYPLSAVRDDLVSYFYAGTLPGAIQEIQEEAAVASEAAGKKGLNSKVSARSLH